MWKKDMEQLIKGMDYYRLEMEQEWESRVGYNAFSESDDSDSCSDVLNSMAETFV